MLRRDRSQPYFMLWSIGNEPRESWDEGNITEAQYKKQSEQQRLYDAYDTYIPGDLVARHDFVAGVFIWSGVQTA